MLIIYECNQCYYELIYEKKPNIHFRNMYNLNHWQLDDNDKHLFSDHRQIVMNQLDDNYNILQALTYSIWF